MKLLLILSALLIAGCASPQRALVRDCVDPGPEYKDGYGDCEFVRFTKR